MGFDGPFDGTSNGDELVGNLAPGVPATIPAHDPRFSEPTELYDTNQDGNSGVTDLFRLSVLPGRNYRVEVRLPETTGGETRRTWA